MQRLVFGKFWKLVQLHTLGPTIRSWETDRLPDFWKCSTGDNRRHAQRQERSEAANCPNHVQLLGQVQMGCSGGQKYNCGCVEVGNEKKFIGARADTTREL